MAITRWTTRANEKVGVGDMVALSVLRYADAVGRIVAEADHGHIQCVLVRGHGKPGTFLRVEEDQLLVKVYG